MTVDLGFTGTATNVSDYTRSGTQIVITAGNTTGTVTLTAVQDTLSGYGALGSISVKATSAAAVSRASGRTSSWGRATSS